MTQPVFWMVAHAEAARHGKSNPKRAYVTKASAIEAAEQLAGRNGAEFAVLEVVHIARPADAQSRGPGFFDR